MTPQELRDRRARLGMTPTEFSRALGVARGTIYQWEAGKRTIPAMVSLAIEPLYNRALSATHEAAANGRVPYVYIQSEPHLWTVGFYRPDGRWEPESDWPSTSDAAARVAYLNGGGVPAEWVSGPFGPRRVPLSA